MITFGNLNPSQVHVSTFNPNSAKPTKHLSSRASMSGTVSRAGSEWSRLLTDNLGLIQSFNDFYHESVGNSLSLAQLGAGSVDRPVSLSDPMSLMNSFVWAGTAGGGTGGGGPTEIEAVFDSNTSKGMAVYVSSDGHVDLAKSDAVATSGTVGLANEDVTATSTGKYQTEGQITKSNWTSITGSASLSPGAVYFLSKDTEGLLTTVAPTATGESVVRVGVALTSTKLDLEVAQPILL